MLISTEQIDFLYRLSRLHIRNGFILAKLDEELKVGLEFAECISDLMVLKGCWSLAGKPENTNSEAAWGNSWRRGNIRLIPDYPALCCETGFSYGYLRNWAPVILDIIIQSMGDINEESEFLRRILSNRQGKLPNSTLTLRSILEEHELIGWLIFSLISANYISGRVEGNLL